MTGTMVQIQTADGAANAYVSRPAGNGPWPGVLFLMDGLGLRDALYAMADRMASHGYLVLLPNLYYRIGAYEPFDPQAVFGGSGPEFDRLMRTVTSLDREDAMRDAGVWFDFLDAQPDVRGRAHGVVGYCLGGGLAIAAACKHPARIGVAASFHGGGFVTEPASTEIIAAQVRAPIYIGVAEIDRRHTAATSAGLEAALARAAVPHAVELYPGSAHGFAVVDLPAYDAASAERHWERLLAYLKYLEG
ncbi:dienelactone hydrolase family protein [Pendulispora brunnea]|uniref:Dienelactone hydrolase family protein n=1 Tax=Pendulispora brunnea TaxID=2905690 RepID=A0ABZ2JZ89_9BACT